MPTTPQYGWSTPAPTDPDDIPTDLASLASQVEATMSTILARLPYRVLTGMVTVTPSAANTPTSVTVTFPAGAFTSPPTMIANAVSAVVGTTVLGVSTNNVTATQGDVVLTRTNTTATPVRWIAIQM